MPTLSYRTSDGACHRVLTATLGGYPLVLDVVDGEARLVDRLDGPGEGPAAAAALAADYCRQCTRAGRALHGPAAARIALGGASTQAAAAAPTSRRVRAAANSSS